MSTESFVHLGVLSDFSPGGVHAASDFARNAHLLGMDALGVADPTIAGWVLFQSACQDNDIRPIFGVRLQFLTNRTPHPEEATLIVESAKGFDSVSALANKGTIATYSDLVSHREGVVVIARAPAYEALTNVYDKTNLYMEINNFCDNSSNTRLESDLEVAARHTSNLIASNRPWQATLAKNNQALSLLLQSRGKKEILPPHLFQSTRQQERNFLMHRHLLALREKGDIRKTRRIYHPEAWLKPPAMMETLFELHPNALTSVQEITQKISVDHLPRPKLPSYPCREGETPMQLLVARCEIGIASRYGQTYTHEVGDRLRHEIEIIGSLGLESHFLIVDDISKLLTKHNIRHAGSGSATCSLVCYLLGITNVDPVAERLPFERFMQKDMKKVSDMDLWLDARQKKAFTRVIRNTFEEKYIYPYHIATFPTYGDRGAIRHILRAFGYDATQISDFQKIIFDQHTKTQPTYEQTLAQEAVQRGLHTRLVSTHGSKFVFTGEPAQGYALYTREEIPLLAINKAEAEYWYEVDLVNSYSLTLITDVMQKIKFTDHIPDDDPKTLSLFVANQAIGVPFAETELFRSILDQFIQTVKSAPTKHDILMLLALSRPAAFAQLRTFLERRTNKNPVVYDNTIVKNILGESLGIIVFQDQVIRLARELGNLTEKEAQRIRRLISKERGGNEIERFRNRFVIGAVANGLDKIQAHKLFTAMASFTGYGFLKGHALTLLRDFVYTAAYLKAHYPKQYMEAVLKLGKSHYFVIRQPDVYKKEARRLGVKLRQV